MLSVVLGSVWIVPVESASAAFSCSNTTHNGVGAVGASSASDSGIDGSSADIYVPNWGTGNLHGQVTTVADTAMLIDDAAGHYFQVGWYIGTSGALPNVSTPHAFFGEGTTSTGTETLSPLNISLSVGAYHNFRLQKLVGNHFYAYIDGNYEFTSVMTTTIKGKGETLGESNYDCPDMDAQADAGGQPELQEHHSGGNWSLWQEHYNYEFGTPASVPSCWTDGRVNGYTATIHAYDNNC